jgi:peptidoglycan/xylan/chitin deacetylase (PgdA/CDA1 family)
MANFFKPTKRKVTMVMLVCVGIFLFASFGYYGLIVYPQSRSFPILMYHKIGYAEDNPLIITPEQLEKELKYLHDNDFHTLTLGEVNGFLREKHHLPRKSILLTFDDGNDSDAMYAMPILKKYDFTATAFIMGETLDNGGISGVKLQQLDKAGWDIGNHTFSHRHFAETSKYEQQQELDLSNAAIGRHLPHLKMRYFSYPVGSYNDDAIATLKQNGFLLAFTTDYGWVDQDTDPYKLPRIAIGPHTGIHEFELEVNSSYVPKRAIKKFLQLVSIEQ